MKPINEILFFWLNGGFTRVYFNLMVEKSTDSVNKNTQY